MNNQLNELEKQLEVYQAKENEIAQIEAMQPKNLLQVRKKLAIFFHNSKTNREEKLAIQEQATREDLAKEYIYNPSHSEEQSAIFLAAAGTEEWTLEDLRMLAAQPDTDSMKLLQRKIEQLHTATQKIINNLYFPCLHLLFSFRRNDKINIIPLLRRVI